eukprot:443270-Pelagomonas_calceolata.AAC.1
MVTSSIPGRKAVHSSPCSGHMHTQGNQGVALDLPRCADKSSSTLGHRVWRRRGSKHTSLRESLPGSSDKMNYV